MMYYSYRLYENKFWLIFFCDDSIIGYIELKPNHVHFEKHY